MTNTLNKTSAKKPNWFYRTVTKFLSSEKLIHFVCFLSVLFIGADLFSFDLIGVTIRYEQVLLLFFAFLLYRKRTFGMSHNIFMWFFCLSSLFSVIFGYSQFRGALYYCWIIYNLVFVFFLFATYVRTFGLKKFIEIFRYTIMIQVFLVALQSTLKIAFDYEFPFFTDYGAFRGVYRFCVWFYEPSYYATFLIFSFALSLYMIVFARDISYILDLVAVGVGLVISTASTGIVGMVVAIFVVFFVYAVTGWKKILDSKYYAPLIILKSIVLIAFVVGAFGMLFLINKFFPDMYRIYIQRIFDDPVGAMGGRVEMWQSVIDVFKRFPLFGVGPGNYGLYVYQDASIVPSNVTLELLSTTGIFSTVMFYAITVYYLVRSGILLKRHNTRSDKLVFACVIALIVFTIVLQANQNYLRLYHWMFFGILQGAIERYDCKKRLFSLRCFWGIPATANLKSNFIVKNKKRRNKKVA